MVIYRYKIKQRNGKQNQNKKPLQYHCNTQIQKSQALQQQENGGKMKYYYIVIDTLQKTLEIFPAGTCQAETEEAIAAAKFGIENLSGIQSIQFSNRFRLIFNGMSNTIDFSKVYKYARKYKVV